LNVCAFSLTLTVEVYVADNTNKEIEKDRKVLIVHPEQEVRDTLSQKIDAHVRNIKRVDAVNGREAMSKIENDAPHVVVLPINLPKIHYQDFIDWVFKKNFKHEMCFIIIGDLPDNNVYIDEVVVGRIQFVDMDDEAAFSRALARVMNYASASTKTLFKMKFLAPNDILLRQGEVGKFVYIVKSGKLHAVHYKGSDVVKLGDINAGEFVGEMAYINGEPRVATVIADTDCELIEIPSEAVDHILFQKPSWAKALTQTLSRRLKRANVD